MDAQIQTHMIRQRVRTLANRVLTKLFQRYWRFSRSVTLGAQGLIFDKDNRILLIKHGYCPGWHFPGGGVEHNETINTALERELFEEVGLIIKSPPKLHGIFTNFRAFPGDHIALFIIKDWEQPTIPSPNREIIEQRFFNYNDLPDDLAKGPRNRLFEIFENQEITETWV